MKTIIKVYVFVLVGFLFGCATLPSFFKAADAVIEEESILLEAAEGNENKGS
jgi:hypothetical protein